MDISPLLPDSLAPALALTLLHSVWQVALLALLGWALLALCGGRRAALRHALGMGVLLAMVAVPAMTFVQLARRTGLTIETSGLPAMAAQAATALTSTPLREDSPLPALLSLAWMLGVAFMVLRHFAGWRGVRALDRATWSPLPADWQRRVDALQAALRIGRRVTVRVAEDVLSPFTAHLLRPVVWLPASMLARLPVAQVEALVAHELAHIARMDWLWNGVQCAVESLLFFHPGAWWLSRRIRQEREYACDDLAVEACGGAAANAALHVAEALAELARHPHPVPHLALAVQGGSLMNRITRLVAGDPGQSRLRWRAPAAVLVVVTAVLAFAVQAGASGNRHPDLEIRTTTDGKLGAGDMREIHSSVDGTDRYYRVSIDKAGNKVEAYELNHKPHPIDAEARAWISKIEAMPPLPPLPPMPPLPPPPPPAPPLPPLPPLGTVADAGPIHDLAMLVFADAGVVARIGAPVRLLDDELDGRIEMSDGNSNGTASLAFDLAGPNGEITAKVVADRKDGAWVVQSIDVEPLQR